MESVNPEFARSRSKITCTRTDTTKNIGTVRLNSALSASLPSLHPGLLYPVYGIKCPVQEYSKSQYRLANEVGPEFH